MIALEDFVIAPPATVSVPVNGTAARFPVHRIYCVGRNYEEHAKEMGFTGREPPFFFLKPADCVVAVEAGQTGTMAYPSLTHNLHHEVELVVAIGKGGKNIQAANAHEHIFVPALFTRMSTWPNCEAAYRIMSSMSAGLLMSAPW